MIETKKEKKKKKNEIKNKNNKQKRENDKQRTGVPMPPRNHKNWTKTPNVEYISSECYNNSEIFAQEQKEIFSKVWIPMCHISEMYNEGNYRTTQIAGQNVIAVNTKDGVRAYRNHGFNRPSGTVAAPIVTVEPQLHCEVKHGGMVWVTLDPNPTQSVDEWTAGAFECIAGAIDTEEMEVIHSQKAVVDANSKLWNETNR